MSLYDLEIALLKRRHQEEKTKRQAAEAKIDELLLQIKGLKRQLMLEQITPYSGDAHSSGRSHYYVPKGK